MSNVFLSYNSNVGAKGKTALAILVLQFSIVYLFKYCIIKLYIFREIDNKIYSTLYSTHTPTDIPVNKGSSFSVLNMNILDKYRRVILSQLFSSATTDKNKPFVIFVFHFS